MLRGDRWAALQRFSRAAGHRGGSCRPVLVRPVRFLEQSSRLYSAVACAAARSEHAAARISRILGPYPVDQRVTLGLLVGADFSPRWVARTTRPFRAGGRHLRRRGAAPPIL